MLDLLVIGAGLSGLMAAYTAAKSGLSVRIVNKGLGSMHWSAATVDLLGYSYSNQKQAVKRPFVTIATLRESNPDHPYALLTEDEIRFALGEFVALTKEIGLPYGGSGSGNNLFLPSPAGAPRPTYLAPQAQLAGDLGRGEPMLIVGFKGMRDFFPHLIADNLNRLGYTARAAFLPLDLLTSRRDANTVHLAQELDDGDRRMKLGKALKNLAKKGERIGLPAILGLNQHGQAYAELSKFCGMPLFEIPTLPPSVPGVRLYTAVRNKLQQMGVRVEPAMDVIASSTTDGQVEWIESETSARPYRQRATNYLLATGGILGAGFDSDHNGRIWETIFDLPITPPQDRSQWFHSSFFSPEGHPVFHGGVTVNQKFQPINTAGQVIYANLWAAGNILAGSDPILERSLEGAAIVTGIAAGNSVVNS